MNDAIGEPGAQQVDLAPQDMKSAGRQGFDVLKRCCFSGFEVIIATRHLSCRPEVIKHTAT